MPGICVRFGCGGKVQITQLILSYKYSSLWTASAVPVPLCLSESGNVRYSVSARKNKLRPVRKQQGIVDGKFVPHSWSESSDEKSW
jgi:hypothetical protein